MLNVASLETAGIFSLFAGLLYSIAVLIVETHATQFRWHFIVLTLVVFTALLFITFFKYLKHRYICDKVDDILTSMKIR